MEWTEERTEALRRSLLPLFRRASDAMPGRFKTMKLTLVNCEKLAADLFARNEANPELRQYILDNFRKDLINHPPENGECPECEEDIEDSGGWDSDRKCCAKCSEHFARCEAGW